MADRLGSEPKSEYVLGHSQREIRRLMLQAAILRSVTERLLRGAGISQGMRVLEMGCGAGDVAMLVAELVGPSGSIVAIDRNEEVIAVARERARTAKLHNVDFRIGVSSFFRENK
jgi:ubiquinone/menaquinone biosynthesis C-methylase UbiE